MGLIARGLEAHGIATTLTSWNPGRTRALNPPRATFTRLGRGATLGRPENRQQQERVLWATLDLLDQTATIAPVRLDEE